MNVDYTIAIRTLGTAGEKYQKLLDSIKRLSVKPKKVLIVLPLGYEKPKERLGYEEFIFVSKGMIIQRMEALRYIDTEYVLFCDDDIEFEMDFVSKLSEPLLEKKAVCSSAALLEFLPPKGIKTVVSSMTGSACKMIFNRKSMYIKILRSGGWSFNRFKKKNKSKWLITESLPWTCFMISVDIMKKINFMDEYWLENTGYAAYEDRVMFYKMVLLGYKTVVRTDISYIHNDAQTSSEGKRERLAYSGAYNHSVFWYRFIYDMENTVINKCIDWIAYKYWAFCSKGYHLIKILTKRESRKTYELFVQGIKDAEKFVKSVEYRQLPEIRK